MSVVAVYQPRYFPRLHYLARAAQADVFVFFDTVEFSRRSRQHRCEISHGSKKWLTIPVRHDGGDTRIMEATVDSSSRWPTKHAKTLQHKYGSEAAMFDDVYEGVRRRRTEPRLVEVTIPILRRLFSEFEVETTVLRASEIDVERPDDASQYIARLVDAVDGDTYLCGEPGYRNYLRAAPFEDRYIDVTVQDWTPKWDGGNANALDVLFGTTSPEEYVETGSEPEFTENVVS